MIGDLAIIKIQKCSLKCDFDFEALKMYFFMSLHYARFVKTHACDKYTK